MGWTQLVAGNGRGNVNDKTHIYYFTWFINNKAERGVKHVQD